MERRQRLDGKQILTCGNAQQGGTSPTVMAGFVHFHANYLINVPCQLDWAALLLRPRNTMGPDSGPTNLDKVAVCGFG